MLNTSTFSMYPVDKCSHIHAFICALNRK